MSKVLQNFYKSTLSLDWSIGTGTFYVTAKPTVTDGWLVISPNNFTLREIVRYTATGTDTNGDYITVTVRGVGGTSEQTHAIGEMIRMNITAEYWKEMTDDIASIVAAGVPNANTTTMGGVEIATDAEVIAGTNTGGTGAFLVATPGQLQLASNLIKPTIKTVTSYGDSTTQFDISNTSGTTHRYTYDGTGTNPGITTTTFPINSKVIINTPDSRMSLANLGQFTITGSGTNYFEVTNAAAVEELNKTLGDGGYLLVFNPTWTKPAGLKYVEVEVVGGGGGGYSGYASPGGGGGAGGYSRKIIAAASLGATETVTIGIGGLKDANGNDSSFGSHLTGVKGLTGINKGGGMGGIGTGGDINIRGGGGSGGDVWNNTGQGGMSGGTGGSSVLGGGGYSEVVGYTGSMGGLFGGGGGGGASAKGSAAVPGGPGGAGVVIIKEFY